ncbi:MAG: DUF3574 domain-containing protein [Ignavibacteria bacterium]
MTGIKSLFYLSMVITALLPFKKNLVTPLDNEEKFIKTELYFGLNKPDGSKIAETDWEAFSDTVISKVFTKGSTILKSDGRWLDGDELIKEESRVVIYFSKIYAMTDEFSGKIDVIRDKYKLYYRQQAVLRTDEFINASF